MMKQDSIVNILVVDDQRSNLLITQGVLQSLGHNVVTATNGKEAIQKLKEQEFAIIILDVQMPIMDGFETAQKIRENPKISHLPILFVTGSESEEIKIFKGYDLGAVDYLIKPIHPRILRGKVSIFLQLYQQQKQLQAANFQLEDRVEQRTQALKQINGSLQDQIKESKKLQKERSQIEQQVRESEQLHRTILHSISDAVFITNSQGEFTFICPNSDIIFGYSKQEIQEMGNIKTLFKADLLNDYNLELLEEVNNIDHQVLDKFDCLHFLLINIKKVKINQGTILYSCRDITERKQAQMALKKRRHYFDTLVKLQQQLLNINTQTIFESELLEPLGEVTEASRVLIYEYCQHNSCLIADPKIEWCANKITPTLYSSQSCPLTSTQAFSFMLKKLIRGEVVSGIVADLPVEERQLLEADQIKSFLIFPLKISDQFYGFLGFVDCLNEKHWDSLEVSILWLVAAAFSSTLERIAIANRLQQSQEKLQNIVNNTSDGLLVVDNQGIVQFLNPTAEALFDIPKEQLLGKHLGFLSGKKGVEIAIHQISGKMVITEMRVTDIMWEQQPATLASLRDITQRRSTEESLQQSLQELYAMKYALDQASIVVRTDSKGMITYVNEKFCEISQYSAQELIGTRHELVHSNYHSYDFWRELWETISKGDIWRGEINNIAKDGQNYWVDTTIVPFLNAQGQPEQYLAIRFDITDRKKAEQSLQALNEDLEIKIAQRTENLASANEKLRQEILEREKVELALRDSQAQLQDFLDNANDLIQSLSLADGRFMYANQAWHRTLGYSVEEIQNLTIFDLIEPSYQDYYLNIFTQMQKGEIDSISQVEVALLSKQKKLILLEGSINYRCQNGQPVATRAIFRDITEQKQIQQAIAASEAQLRAIFDNAAVGIALGTVEGRVIKVNHALIKMLGYQLSDLLQMHFADFTHPDDLQSELEAFQELLKGDKKFYQMKKRYLCANGKIMWGQLTVSLIYKNDSRVICEEQRNCCFVVGIVEDISEQVMAEQEMQKALEKERELNQLKDQFIDIVSHEFRTPLTSILGYTELLTKYPNKFSPDKKQKHLERIYMAGEQMKTLIEDVLYLSRANSGKLKFDPQPLNLVTFCQDLIEVLQIGIGEGHQLQFDYPDELAMETINLDKKLLQPILTNLLTNSIKYSPPESEIELLIEKTSNTIIFFVKDQGIGIPASDQLHLFESFHRAENVGNIQGTGLGLNIVQRYVNLHQGNIIFSSIINEETIFRVALPFVSQVSSSSG
ncbi:MAG: PAS domain S-box protein [Microcystaceae cyanobacterium]